MNGTNVSSAILSRLSDAWEDLTPEAQKAARYVLENPADVGVSTVREIAEAAQVKPNTVVRMARQVGFEGYDDFREPFREAIRKGQAGFPDRARWLQDIERQGEMGALFAEMFGGAIRNLEDTFAGISAEDLRAAAQAIWTSDQVFTLGVGVNNASARNFSYLASTGMVRFHAIPRSGNSATDDLAFAGAQDILIAITQLNFNSSNPPPNNFVSWGLLNTSLSTNASIYSYNMTDWWDKTTIGIGWIANP